MDCEDCHHLTVDGLLDTGPSKTVMRMICPPSPPHHPSPSLPTQPVLLVFEERSRTVLWTTSVHDVGHTLVLPRTNGDKTRDTIWARRHDLQRIPARVV